MNIIEEESFLAKPEVKAKILNYHGFIRIAICISIFINCILIWRDLTDSSHYDGVYCMSYLDPYIPHRSN